MKKELNSKLNVLVIFIVTFIVLFFSLKDNFNEIINQIINIDKKFLILAFLLILVYYFLRSVILDDLIRKFKKKQMFWDSFSLTLKTQFFNGVTPFSLGGQPFQVYVLKKEGIKLSNATNIIVQEFIVYQIALVLLGIIAIITNHYYPLFEDVKILGTSDAIKFERENAGPVNFTYDFIYKRFYKLDTYDDAGTWVTSQMGMFIDAAIDYAMGKQTPMKRAEKWAKDRGEAYVKSVNNAGTDVGNAWNDMTKAFSGL